MFNKLINKFKIQKGEQLITYKCKLCEEDTKGKNLYNQKCCPHPFCKKCYKKWQRIFGMKPCCFS